MTKTGQLRLLCVIDALFVRLVGGRRRDDREIGNNSQIENQVFGLTTISSIRLKVMALRVEKELESVVALFDFAQLQLLEKKL